MTNEIWKPISGWPYEISDKGNVRNSNRDSAVKPWKQRNGYLSVTLHLGGSKKSYRIHRLVAEAFIPNTENKTEVNHIDGNKENNAVENLEWATHKENMGHAFDNGLCQISDSHLQELKKKLSDPEVRKKASESRKRAVVRSDGEIFDSVKSAAESCGAKPSTLSSHLHGRVKSVKGYTFEWADRLTALIERGDDHCIQNLGRVVNACCGHGTHDGYIQFDDGRTIRGRFTVEPAPDGWECEPMPEIIRCRDCGNGMESGWLCKRFLEDVYNPDIDDDVTEFAHVNPDGFCAWAVRK